MRSVWGVMVLALLLGFGQAADAQVSIDEVIKLKRAGFSEAQIKRELERRKARFNLRSYDESRLRKAGLSASLIAWMKATGGGGKATPVGQRREPGKLPAGPKGDPPKWGAAGSGGGTGPQLTFASLKTRIQRRESASKTLEALRACPKKLTLAGAELAQIKRIAHPAVFLYVRGKALTGDDLVRLAKARSSESMMRIVCAAVGAGKPDPASALTLVQSGVPTALIKDLRNGKYESTGAASGASRGPIKIALIAPITGTEGQQIARGAQAMVASLTRAGGVGGQPITVELHDSKGDAATARLLAGKVVADASVTAIVGGTTPACARMILDACRGKVALVSLSSIKHDPSARTAFSLASSAADEGAFIARYLGRAGKRRVALVRDTGGAGADLARAFTKAARSSMVRLAIEERVTGGAPLGANSIATRIAERRPSAVVFACGEREAKLLIKTGKFGSATLIVARDAATSEVLGLSDGLRFVGSYAPGAGGSSLKAFATSYEAAHSEPASAHAVLGADGVALVAEAAREAGNGRDGIRARLGGDGLGALTGLYRFGKSGDRRPLLMLVHAGGKVTADRKQPGASSGSSSGGGSGASAVSAQAIARAKAPYRLRFTQRQALMRKYGTRRASASVAKALRWLAAYQEANGKWDCDNWDRGATGEAAPGNGKMGWVDPGVTAIALMAFLAEGNTHEEGPYKDTVHRALGYLMKVQQPSGLVGGKRGHYMYNHSIATLALCEAYGMTGNARVGSAASSAVAFLLRAQNPNVAWRYAERDGDNDMSVSGWCVIALRAAQLAEVPGVDQSEIETSLRWACKFVEGVTDSVNTISAYKRRVPKGWTGPTSSRFQNDEMGVRTTNTHCANHTPTAIATLIRAASPDYKDRDARFKAGCQRMLEWPPCWGKYKKLPPLKTKAVQQRTTRRPVKPPVKAPSRKVPKTIATDLYYWYQGTLAMYHAGSSSQWKKWKSDAYDALTKNQVKRKGALEGSWEPSGAWGFAGGRVYSTAIGALILQSPYRFPKRFVGKK